MHPGRRRPGGPPPSPHEPSGPDASVEETRREFLLSLAAVTPFAAPSLRTLLVQKDDPGEGAGDDDDLGKGRLSHPGKGKGLTKSVAPAMDGGDFGPSSVGPAPPWTRPPGDATLPAPPSASGPTSRSRRPGGGGGA